MRRCAPVCATPVFVSPTFVASFSHTHTKIIAGSQSQLRDEAKNAQVYVHDWETGHRHSRLQYDEHRALLERAGVPEKEIQLMRRMYEGMREYADTLDDNECVSLKDEAELEFESGSLRILHTPGHTPGSCSFLREADRTLIAGDCVLKRITPNPVLSPDPLDPSRRFPSLAEYLVSLARLRACSPTLVYGGHGDVIRDYEELFHRYFRAFQERQSQVIGLVKKSGVTAWEVGQAMFPGADDVHRFLAVSEAVAHLDLAHSEGKIAVELAGPTEVYKPKRSLTDLTHDYLHEIFWNCGSGAACKAETLPEEICMKAKYCSVFWLLLF